MVTDFPDKRYLPSFSLDVLNLYSNHLSLINSLSLTEAEAPRFGPFKVLPKLVAQGKKGREGR